MEKRETRTFLPQVLVDYIDYHLKTNTGSETLKKYLKKGKKSQNAFRNGIYSVLHLYQLDFYKQQKKVSDFIELPTDFYKEVITPYYYKYLFPLKEWGVLEALSVEVQDEKDLFKTRKKESFSTSLHISKSYRFCERWWYLFDTEMKNSKHKWVEIPVELKQVGNTNFNLLLSSLADIGITGEGNYHKGTSGLRIYWKGITKWREVIQNYKHKDKLVVVDCKCSQPTQLLMDMEEFNISCPKYREAILGDTYFYTHLSNLLYEKGITHIRLCSKNSKRLWLIWVFGGSWKDKLGDKLLSRLEPNKPACKEQIMTQLEIKRCCEFLDSYFDEVVYWKSLVRENRRASHLQRREANIWVDEFYKQMPDEVDFCLPIHDSFIVKEKHADSVVKMIKDKYPLFKLHIQKIEINNDM
jgi:hypothetical protein